MQICLDGRIASHPGGTGVATYARTLALAAGQAGFGVQVLAEGRLQPSRARRWFDAAVPRTWPAPLGPGGTRTAADAFRTAQVRFDMTGRFLSVADPAAPPALMHWSYPQPIRFRGVPNLYTVHDLIPLLHPALTAISATRMRRILHRLRGAAAHLVTVSEASRAELIRELGWPPGRVTNTYQAVADPPPAPPAVAAALSPLGLRAGGYILCAGSVEPRKNVRRLLHAYRASGLTVPLVLAGPDGWRAEEELHGLHDLPGLSRLPWVDRPVMLALLSGARFTVAPSLAEGFGLVVAESMAFGTPVLTSRDGATAEIAGGAALLVDPRGDAALAEALRTLDADPALRADLRLRGLHRARSFGMDAYAGRLRDLYSRVARAPMA